MPVITQPLAYFTALQSVSVIPPFRRNCIAIVNSDRIALGRHNVRRVLGSCVGRSIVDLARAATLPDMQFGSCVLCISPSYRGLVGLWLRRAWHLRSGNSSSQHNIPPAPAASSSARQYKMPPAVPLTVRYALTPPPVLTNPAAARPPPPPARRTANRIRSASWEKR